MSASVCRKLLVCGALAPVYHAFAMRNLPCVCYAQPTMRLLCAIWCFLPSLCHARDSGVFWVLVCVCAERACGAARRGRCSSGHRAAYMEGRCGSL
eukprot:171700-Rhodomonas_salina.1